MKISKKTALLIMSCFLFTTCENTNMPVQENTAPFRLVVYIETGEWGWRRDQNNEPKELYALDKIDAAKITHVNYGFAVLGGQDFTEIIMPKRNWPVVQDTMILEKVMSWKRQNPGLKVLLSIGGWKVDGFSQMASSHATRTAFAENCLSVINTYGFDGIDLDWEYPGFYGSSNDSERIAYTNSDVDNYLLLLREIRNKIGTNKLLSICLDGGGMDQNRRVNSVEYFTSIRGKAFHEVLDYVNIMAYDNGNENAAYNWAINLLNIYSNNANHGFTRKQLNLGLPFFSRSATPTLDYKSYEEMINELIGTQGGVFNNANTNAHRIIMPDNTWCSIESPEMIRRKMQFVRDNGFGGAMVYELSQDKNNDLLNTIYSNLNGDGMYQSPYLPVTY